MKIRVPATSANLGPGFDCLGLALAFYNDVVIKPSNSLLIDVVGEGSDRENIKRDNTFVKIFYEIYEELVGKKDNFAFTFINNIPFSRGLGSSSSVIVGAIASAYHLAKVKIDKQSILDRALKYENHPDNIAPATFGGFVVSIVNGNRVIKIKKELPNNINSVVVIPNEPISTKVSRTLLPKSFIMKDMVFNLSHSSFLSSAFMSENWELLKYAAKDKIHEDKRMSLMPELFDVRRVAQENGALMSTLSGSGSTFFNLTYKQNSKRLCEALKSSFGNFKVLELEFDNNGFVIFDE